MDIKVGNDIKITNPTLEVGEWAQKYLTIDNPEYYKKVKQGKWTGNTPQKIWLYEIYPNGIVVPFGCFKKLWELYPIKSAYSCEINAIQSLEYKSDIKLYTYQENAANAIIRAKNGVLVMPCGSGKTQTGLEVIARLGGRALWLTHTQDLLNQSFERAKNTLDINGTFGKISEGKVNIGTHITFATVQTMCKLDLTKYKDCFDIIVVDECQHCCGTPTRVTQFYKVLSSLSARYKIGLTATPKRADGLERTMYALLGGVIYTVSREDVADTTCPIKVERHYTGWYPDVSGVLTGDGTIDYHKVVENLIDDPARFELVADYISKIPSGNPVIVLANRVEYLQRLCQNYTERNRKAVCLSGMGNSKRAKELRKKVLQSLNEGELDCVFASYKLAAEGLDCPNLKYVVLATPEKDPSLIQQASGRVGRKATGKEYGTVIDFIDSFGLYRGWAKKREAVYKKLGYEYV